MMNDNKTIDNRKQYTPPALVVELDLETRAGSVCNVGPLPWDQRPPC